MASIRARICAQSCRFSAFLFFIIVELAALVTGTRFANAGESHYEVMERKWEAAHAKPEEPLKPFRESEITDKTTCRYLNNSYDHLDEEKDALFQQVRGIYIQASTYSKYSYPALRTSIFDEQRIAELAACFLGRNNRVSSSIPPESTIPIYVPQRSTPITQWREADENGDLLIWIEVGMENGTVFEDLAHDGILIARVRYYRHDVHTVNDILQQCSEPFPNSPDQDQLLRFLSRALVLCLNHRYTPLK